MFVSETRSIWKEPSPVKIFMTCQHWGKKQRGWLKKRRDKGAMTSNTMIQMNLQGNKPITKKEEIHMEHNVQSAVHGYSQQRIQNVTMTMSTQRTTFSPVKYVINVSNTRKTLTDTWERSMVVKSISVRNAQLLIVGTLTCKVTSGEAGITSLFIVTKDIGY